MNPLTIVNAAANLIVIGSVLDVAFRVFGRPDHPMHKHKAALIARKTISSMVICGALLNLYTLSTPAWTEILLNVSFAASYLFSSYYDRAYLRNVALPTKVPEQHPAGGACGTRKTKQNTAAGGSRGKRTPR